MAKAKPSGTAMKRIVWAVDPFEERSRMRTEVEKTLADLARDWPAQVEPVYVLSPSQVEIPLEFTKPFLTEYKVNSQKAVDATLRGAKIPNLKPGKVITHLRPSLTGSVDALTTFAKGRGADLIVVASHSRGGVSRLMLGSFAETLLLRSKIPVLIVGATAKESAGIGRILFPTDFSEASHKAYKRVVRLASSLGADLTLLHAIPDPIGPVYQSGVYLLGGGWAPVPVFFEKQSKRQREAASKWIAEAGKSGVKAELKLDVKTPGVTHSILTEAKKSGTSFIAMAAQSGPVVSALIGSITRQVVRNSPRPVWVLRS